MRIHANTTYVYLKLLVVLLHSMHTSLPPSLQGARAATNGITNLAHTHNITTFRTLSGSFTMTNPSLDGETVESVGRTILYEPQSIVDGDDMSFIYASNSRFLLLEGWGSVVSGNKGPRVYPVFSSAGLKR